MIHELKWWSAEKEIKRLKDENERLKKELAVESAIAQKSVDAEERNYRMFQAATAAMQGLLSNSGIIDIHDERGKNWIKEHSISQARALIEALDKEVENPSKTIQANEAEGWGLDKLPKETVAAFFAKIKPFVMEEIEKGMAK